jgi:thioredoxin 1
MKKSMLITAMVFALSQTSLSQVITSITSVYEGPYVDVTTEAARMKRFVLLDFSGKGCKTCRKMEAEVFQNNSIADKLNNEFITYKVDVDSFEGKQLAKQYKIADYPAFVVVDPKQKTLGKIVGYWKEKEFLSELASLQNGVASGKVKSLFSK